MYTAARLFCLFFLLLGTLARAQSPVENDFKKNNPDGYKYEFARSYISALKYFYFIDQRWSKKPPKEKFPNDDVKTIRASMEYLVLDNMDLRVAKNYMIKYLNNPNSLVRKTADTMIVACNKDISLNDQQKDLWQKWLDLKTSGKAKSEDEKAFINAQQEVELKRKDSDINIIQASVWMTKILLSQDNQDAQGHQLAITQKQRNRLLDDLDVYGKDVLDWGFKPGQSTLEASIAVIREILEDPIFIAHKS